MKILNIRDMETSAAHREFLRVPALSMGLFNPAIDTAVPQQPHTEDDRLLSRCARGLVRGGFPNLID